MERTIRILKELIGESTKWYRGDYHSCEVSMTSSESGIRLKVFDICTNSISHLVDIFPNNRETILITRSNGEVETINVRVPKTKNTINKFYEMIYTKIIRKLIIETIPEDIRMRYKNNR